MAKSKKSKRHQRTNPTPRPALKVRGALRLAHNRFVDSGKKPRTRVPFDLKLKKLHEVVDDILKDVTCDEFDAVAEEMLALTAEMEIVHAPFDLPDDLIDSAEIIFKTPAMDRLLNRITELAHENQHLTDDAIVDFVIARTFPMAQPQAAN